MANKEYLCPVNVLNSRTFGLDGRKFIVIPISTFPLSKSSSPGSVNQQLGYIAFVVWNLFENKRKGWSADGQ